LKNIFFKKEIIKDSLIATPRSAISWKNFTKKNLTEKNFKKTFRKFSVKFFFQIFFFDFFGAIGVPQPIWGMLAKILGV
jgi:hypothetical protein